MRLRLVHTLTLLLLSAVLLAVLAMGGVMAWNLRNGFADFMESRDVERLEQFAALVTEAAAEAGSLSALRQNTRMHDLLDRYAQQQGLVARGLPEPGGAGLRPGGPGGRLGRPGGPGGPGGYGPPPGVLPPGGADGFGARVSVVGVDGQALLAGPGRPLDVAAGPFIDRPITLQGEVIALARLRPGARVPDAVETRFLRSQYLGILAVAAALLLLAVISARWAARRWATERHGHRLAARRRPAPEQAGR